jgi:hypothetical protein
VHQPLLRLFPCRLAGHDVRAGADLADHQVQHGIGLGVELAVGDDPGDLLVDLRRQFAVLLRAHLAGVNRFQLRCGQFADLPHALAQRLVGAPLAPLVQTQFVRRVSGMVVTCRLRGSHRRRAQRCSTQGHRQRGQEPESHLYRHDENSNRMAGGVIAACSLRQAACRHVRTERHPFGLDQQKRPCAAFGMGQITPCASMASATLTKPATLAPST